MVKSPHPDVATPHLSLSPLTRLTADTSSLSLIKRLGEEKEKKKHRRNKAQARELFHLLSFSLLLCLSLALILILIVNFLPARRREKKI